MAKTFYDHFLENMKRMNLPAPETLFGTLTTATASIGPMVKFIQTYGTRTTVAEMILTLPSAAAGAGGGIVGLSAATSEALLVVGGLSAAFYVGACIGSFAVAAGKSFSGGVSISDCLSSAETNGIDTPKWLQETLAQNPVILGFPLPSSSTHQTWTA